jgi:CheY-like chemotaxis protein
VPEHVASVLVVDDDADIRDAICGVLEGEGYTTLTAENGQMALTLLEKGRRPCVVLLDLMMPVMNGWEFMKAISGKGDLDDRVRAKSATDGERRKVVVRAWAAHALVAQLDRAAAF